MSFNKTHPECQGDEVFITNADFKSYSMIGWKTKRRGSVAYDIHGEPLGNRWPGGFPVFVKKDEIRQDNPRILQNLES